MAAKHKTHISHVDLDKAFTNIRNYSGARIDRKVFKIIAAEANDEGVVRLTTHMSDLLYRVSGADDIFNSDGMSNSLYRLIRKGIIERASYSFDDCGYPHGTITIAPGYMLHTATTPEPSDGTKRIQNIEKRLDHLTKVVANDDSEKKIVKLENRIEKLEHDNKMLREEVKDCADKLEEPIRALEHLSNLANRQYLNINTLLANLVYQLHS